MLVLLCLIKLVAARMYKLEDDFTSNPSSFFDSFTFFNQPDPTHGMVNYLSREDAFKSGIVGYSFLPTIAPGSSSPAENVLIGVDASQTINSTSIGRASVRLESTKSYGPGTLWAIDLQHLPETCGSWPAFWALGAGTWPEGGEIDIIENGNALDTESLSTLHTTAGCVIQTSSVAAPYSGSVVTQDCDVNAPDQDTNQGCTIRAPSGSPTFGAPFNAQGGGMFVTEYGYAGFSVWFFAHGERLPASLAAGTTPNTHDFGIPIAHFAGTGCDWEQHFASSNGTGMRLIINTSICGDWAGSVWQSGGCAALTGFDTCEEFASDRPEAFQNAYWSIRSLRTYVALKGMLFDN